MDEHAVPQEPAFGTRAVHSGREHPDGLRPVVPPIHASVSYMAEDPDDLRAVLAGEKEGFVYSRNGNPTVEALRRCIADLEEAGDAVVFGSGMAAMHAALLAALLSSPNRSVVASSHLYGVTISLLNNVLAPLGVKVTYADLTDTSEAREAIERERPAVVLCETVSNPLLRLVDVPALAEVSHASGALLFVDNTFATPLLTRPLEHGADLVIHSTTKYLGGHGDVVGGAVAGPWDICGQARAMSVFCGGVAGPYEAWLTLRGIRTLGLRVPKQCSNAMVIAHALETHPKVSRVNYPGLPSHPQHDLARRLMKGGFGGMVSFELKENTVEAANRFMHGLRLCLPATSLGDVYTLVLHPVNSSHLTMSPEARERVGITPGLLRLSAGVEDDTDIVADLTQALDLV